ncbi:unnamed protein product [Allacma fusca]|uniref:Stabilizer of axonemal microtubules 2 n=1 Tax=Allacma fusca TaxID=39272 RepID=A0A8J2K1X6_9HEXA|nr:unnamed protein product [Allacma fusca]
MACKPNPCIGSNAVCLNKTPPWAKMNQYVPSCAPFEGESMYRSAYTGCAGAKSVSLKPTTFFDPSVTPFDGISTYRSTYIPMPTIPYEKPAWAKKAEFDPSDAPFAGISTYRGDYRGCMGEPVKSLKPTTFFDPSVAPMEDKTTHRISFVPYCIRDSEYARQRSAKPAFEGEASCAPFDGMTTYRCDYFPRCSPPPKSLKPDPRPRFSDQPFADLSTYRNDYPPFHFVDCNGDNLQNCSSGGNGFDSPYCHNPCPPPPDCCSGAIPDRQPQEQASCQVPQPQLSDSMSPADGSNNSCA